MAERMNEQQADARAKELWGPQAYVLDRAKLVHSKGLVKRCGRFYVGCPSIHGNFPFGNGNTWEQAFEDVKNH